MDHNQVEILLVEDNPTDAALTIRAFKKENLANNLLHVKDGADALDFIFAKGAYSVTRSIMHQPNVILLDINLPLVNGIEVLEKIKADERTKTIPVVMLTSSNEDPDIARCYELGANSYIVKPVDFQQFEKVIIDLGIYWKLLNKTKT